MDGKPVLWGAAPPPPARGSTSLSDISQLCHSVGPMLSQLSQHSSSVGPTLPKLHNWISLGPTLSPLTRHSVAALGQRVVLAIVSSNIINSMLVIGNVMIRVRLIYVSLSLFYVSS